MKREKSIDRSSAATAVIYLRVSTKEQAEKGGRAEGFSIPAQREALHRKAQGMGAVIVAEFVDAGESAKSADRPDLQRMLDYLRDNAVDYVLVHKVDRLARNRVDDVAITMAIKKSGATLVSATENIDETPSGMLLHGIMSSIAEFYSRNLATEVHKGMSQKAKTGGTPGRAPLGYGNIGRLTPEGREERTVAIDPQRAELISWAFTAFATGEWTLRTLAGELADRGLTTRRTPKQPARQVGLHALHSILTNPYYKGEVIYRGVAHRGRHHPLTDAATWQEVQDILAAHAVGEKQREHPHYLKSSVFCGGCSSRLIITNAKNRHGAIYPYFVCVGRHQKRTTCTRKAMLVPKVEQLIEDHWAAVQLEPALRQLLEGNVRALLATQRHEATVERKQLLDARTALTTKREKLVEAIYSGALPLDLIADEQKHITTQLTTIEQRLSGIAATFDRVDANLSRLFDLMSDCHASYLAAGPSLRRLFNQGLFTHLYIDDDVIRGEYAPPFDVILDRRTPATDPAGQPSVLKNAVLSLNRKKSPGAQHATGRSHIPIAPFGGLKMTVLAALGDALSKPGSPLLKLLEIHEKRDMRAVKATRFDTAKLTIAQTGAADPTCVRLRVKENKKLSRATIDQLVHAYYSGASQKQLADEFGVHVETVNRHIRRRRQAHVIGCFIIDRPAGSASAHRVRAGYYGHARRGRRSISSTQKRGTS